MTDINNTRNPIVYIKENKGSIPYIIIISLILVIVGLIIFGGKEPDNSLIEAELERIKLEKEESDKKMEILNSTIANYEEKLKEWDEKEKLHNIEMAKQKKITEKLNKQKKIAEENRKRVEQELKEFKETIKEYKNSDLKKLLIDTQKMINARK